MSVKLVAFFSGTGTTFRVAKLLAESISAALYEIKPSLPYTTDDLNWNNKHSRTSIEQHDKSSRPKLADTDAKISQHQTVYLGFPIWWYTSPQIIKTFLESYDFSGKKIVLFATSGGSELGSIASELQPCAKGAEIITGRVMNSPSKADLKRWAEQF